MFLGETREWGAAQVVDADADEDEDIVWLFFGCPGWERLMKTNAIY